MYLCYAGPWYLIGARDTHVFGHRAHELAAPTSTLNWDLIGFVNIHRSQIRLLMCSNFVKLGGLHEGLPCKHTNPIKRPFTEDLNISLAGQQSI